MLVRVIKTHSSTLIHYKHANKSFLSKEKKLILLSYEHLPDRKLAMLINGVLTLVCQDQAQYDLFVSTLRPL